jgi:hypothetical protein
LKRFYKIVVCVLVLLNSIKQYANTIPKCLWKCANKTLNIQQELTYFNQSNDTLSSLILNDWNNAYSDVNTPLARRFSDEFYRGFHLAKAGSTQI